MHVWSFCSLTLSGNLRAPELKQIYHLAQVFNDIFGQRYLEDIQFTLMFILLYRTKLS